MANMQIDAAPSAGSPNRARIAAAGSGVLGFVARNPLGAAGAVVLLILILMALAAPVIAPWPEHKGDFSHMSGEPNADHLFGTDPQGRDILSRAIFGTRSTLTVAFVAVLFGTTIGSPIGIVSAYSGGKVDMIIQRLLEVLQAFPDVILALLLLAALDPTLSTVIIAISVTRIPFGGRVIRSVPLQIREMEYVTSARAIGASDLRIMFSHVAPQTIAPYLILATAHLGVAILIESGLGFLGAGVPPLTATWGNMLAFANFSSFTPLWWMAVYPGLAITITVLAFNLFGDSLRDVLDPRLRGRGVLVAGVPSTDLLQFGQRHIREARVWTP